MRPLLNFLWQEWKGLRSQIETLNAEVERVASSDPTCLRLQTVAINKDWHARIIIMRRRSLSGKRPDTFLQTVLVYSSFFLQGGGEA